MIKVHFERKSSLVSNPKTSVPPQKEPLNTQGLKNSKKRYDSTTDEKIVARINGSSKEFVGRKSRNRFAKVFKAWKGSK